MESAADRVAELEDLMRRAPSGEVDAGTFYTALADTELLVLLTAESTPDDLNLPVLDRDGTSVVPVFTSEQRMADFGAGDRNHLLIHGRELVNIWPAGMAAALNPGTEGQAMDIPADVVTGLAAHSVYEPPPEPLTGAADEVGELELGGLTVAPSDDVTAAVDRAVADLDEVHDVRLYTVQDIGREPETAVVVQFATGRSAEAELPGVMAALLEAVRRVSPSADLMAPSDVEEARLLLPEFATDSW